jgi:predicted small lipoprotein YifL
MTRILLFLLLLCSTATGFGQKGPAASRYLPPSDPNLDPTWDWTTPVNNVPNGYQVVFNPAATTTTTNVQLPFNSSGHPLSDALSHLTKDMYPEDGWMLVYRDFGTPGAAIQPKLPFFVLYNKYRGKLRVMVYNGTGVSYSAYRMSLSFRSTSPKGALLTFTSNSQTTLENYNKLNPNDNLQYERFLGAATASQGWFYGDFTLFGYDPSLSPDAIMHLDITNIDITKLHLASTKFSLNEVLRDNSPGGADVSKGVKFFDNVESIRKAASELSSTSNVLKKLADSKALSVVPFLGPALGIIGLFIGGQDVAAPREPMQFNGALEMTGDAQTERPFWEEDFALSPGKTNTPEVYRPVQAIPWGVFNLDNRPTYHVTQDNSGCEYDPWFGSTLCWDSYSIGLDNPVTYKFNPAVGMTLTKVELRTDQMPDFVSLADFNQYGFSYFYDQRGVYSSSIPQRIYLKLTFHINNPVRNSDPNIVVFKDLGACYNNYGQVSECTPGQRLAASPPAPARPKPQNEDLTIAPNPASALASFNFVNTTAGQVEVQILDITGRQLWAKTSTMQAGHVHYQWNNTTAKLAPGTYIVNVRTADWHQARRMVIQ